MWLSKFGWSRSVPGFSSAAMLMAGMVMMAMPGCSTPGNAHVVVKVTLPGGELYVEVNIEWGAAEPALPVGSVYVGEFEYHGKTLSVYQDPAGDLWIKTGPDEYNKLLKGEDELRKQLPPKRPGGGGGSPDIVPDGEIPPLPGDAPEIRPYPLARPVETIDTVLIETIRTVLAQLPPDEQVTLATSWADAVPGLVTEFQLPHAEPTSDDVVVVIEDATLEADEDADTATLRFTFPNQDIEVVDPATTGFDVTFTRVDNPDGTVSITYVGTINNVLGAAMHQGITEIAFTDPILGAIAMTIDAAMSMASSTVNGALAPDPYGVRTIWTPEGGGAE